MKKANITGDILFGAFCILMLGIIFYFVLRTPLYKFTYIIVISGIFSFFAFVVTSYVLIKNRLYAGFSIAFGLISLSVTLLQFNYRFSKNEAIHNLAIGLIIAIVLFVSLIKLWDTVHLEN